MKRKKHYNEFQAVKLARKLMEQDDDDDEEDEETEQKEDCITMEEDDKREDLQPMAEEASPSV